jgi:DNA-binding transcriptional regulator YhcF (GntR family)
MFVLKDAQKKLLKYERERFLAEEFPEFLRRIRRLGLDKEELIRMIREAGA